MKIEEAIQTAKFRNPTHKAALNILYTAWWIKTITSNTLKPFQITQEQYNILRILKGKHPNKMSVKDIASRMIEKNSNVPRIIDKLQDKKFIIRTAGKEDARHTMIELTTQGIKTLQLATDAINMVWDNTLTLNPKEAETLSELLEKMRVKE